jgi:hypothetical protein
MQKGVVSSYFLFIVTFPTSFTFCETPRVSGVSRMQSRRVAANICCVGKMSVYQLENSMLVNAAERCRCRIGHVDVKRMESIERCQVTSWSLGSQPGHARAVCICSKSSLKFPKKHWSAVYLNTIELQMTHLHRQSALVYSYGSCGHALRLSVLDIPHLNDLNLPRHSCSTFDQMNSLETGDHNCKVV